MKIKVISGHHRNDIVELIENFGSFLVFNYVRHSNEIDDVFYDHDVRGKMSMILMPLNWNKYKDYASLANVAFSQNTLKFFHNIYIHRYSYIGEGEQNFIKEKLSKHNVFMSIEDDCTESILRDDKDFRFLEKGDLSKKEIAKSIKMIDLLTNG